MSIFLKAVDQQLETEISQNEYNLIDIFRATFLCGRRAIEDWHVLEDQFAPRIHRLAAVVSTVSPPSDWIDPFLVFYWHRLLDSATRFYKRNPAPFTDSDRNILDTLHALSLEMFDLCLESERKEFMKYVKGKPKGDPQTLDASAGKVEWDQVLRDYAEVEVREPGKYTDYGDQWDYQMLRVDYKHRIEFMLNYEENPWFQKSFREDWLVHGWINGGSSTS